MDEGLRPEYRQGMADEDDPLAEGQEQEPTPEIPVEGKGTRRERGKTRLANKSLPKEVWEEIERLYVFGTVSDTNGKIVRTYPSYGDIAKKHRVPKSTVHYYAKKNKWAERRDAFVAELRRQFDEGLAKVAAVAIGDYSGLVQQIVEKFAAQLESGSIKLSVADLERAMKIKGFIESEQANVAERGVGLTLAELQKRHAKVRKGAKGLTSAMTGDIPGRTQREAADALSGGEAPPDVGPQPGHRPGHRQDDPLGEPLPDCYWEHTERLVIDALAEERAASIR